MKIFSWNVNGLRAVLRKGALAGFIDKYNPDILMLQETKISAVQVAESGVDEVFPEYAKFYSYAKKAGYAGTAVWVRRGIEAAQVAVDFDGDGLVDEYGDLLNEGRLTVVETKSCYNISVYVPNSKDDLSRLAVRGKWDKMLADYVAGLEKKKPVVMGGDFNVAHEEIDLARPKENAGKHGFTNEERAGFSALLSKTGLVDSFRALEPEKVAYSWWSHWGNARANNVGWRIDYLLTSPELKVSEVGICPEVMGSDHCPVMAEV